MSFFNKKYAISGLFLFKNQRLVSTLKKLQDGCIRVPTIRAAYKIPSTFVDSPSGSLEYSRNKITKPLALVEQYEKLVCELENIPSGYLLPKTLNLSNSPIDIPGLKQKIPRIYLKPLATKRLNLRGPINRDKDLIKEINEMTCPKIMAPNVFTVLGGTERVDGSTRRMNQLSRQIKGLKVKDAIVQMKISRRGGAMLVAETLEHMVEAAKIDRNTPQDVKKCISQDSLIVAESWVCPGTPRKGIVFHGKGRSGKLKRRAGHTMFRLAMAPEWSIPKNRGNQNCAMPYQMKHVPKQTRRVKHVLENIKIPITVKKLFLDA